jgi:hypothetical protein
VETRAFGWDNQVVLELESSVGKCRLLHATTAVAFLYTANRDRREMASLHSSEVPWGEALVEEGAFV